MLKETFYKLFLPSVIFTAYFPQIALAYVGPGTGLSAIGAFLALLAALVIAIIGFFWYPLKRFLGKKGPREPVQTENKEE